MKRRVFKFDKLARDLLYDKWISSGAEVYWHKLGQSELNQYFQQKILEEANEVITASNLKDTIEELGDLLEVIHAYSRVIGSDFNEVDQARQLKRGLKGGFDNCIVVDKLSLKPDDSNIKYLISSPDKYPEQK